LNNYFCVSALLQLRQPNVLFCRPNTTVWSYYRRTKCEIHSFWIHLNSNFRIHSQTSREFCRPTTSCESPASSDCQHNSPSSSSASNSPLSTHNQTTVYSPCSYPQQQSLLTPASTSSEPSPQYCPASSAPSPLLYSGLYSPESPNYWLVQSSTIVAGELDW
jgi:hypothetical protein